MRYGIVRCTSPCYAWCDRLEADTFDELAQRLLAPIRTTYADLQIQIDTIGDAIVQEDILRDRLRPLQRERDAPAKKIDSAKREQQKLIPKGNEERAKRLAALETACTTVQAKVEGIRHRQKTIDDLSAAARYETEAAGPTRFAAMRQRFAGAKLTAEEWQTFQLKFAGDTGAAIASARARAVKALKLAQEGDPENPTDKTSVPLSEWPLNVLRIERDTIKSAVGIDAARQKRYDDAQKQIGLDESTLAKLDLQLEQAKGAEARRRGGAENRADRAAPQTLRPGF